MRLDPTDDQRAMVDAAEALLAAEYAAGGEDLSALADFGAFALALPEEAGGLGLGAIDEALLHVRLGRSLVAPSALAAAVAARLAWGRGEGDLARGIAAGEVAVSAGVRHGDDLLLFQPADYALWSEGTALRFAPVPTGTEVPAMGHDSALTRLPCPAKATTGAPDRWLLLASAQLLGVAEGARDLAVAYALMREQFGRPIGSFQALKHQAADMALGTERLSALLDFTALAMDAKDPDAAFHLAALARIAPGIALANARRAIQIHGAIGFSAEARPHLFLKQAHRLALLVGRPDMMALPAPLAPYDRSA